LGEQAERAGWVGCNILLKSIPQTGKIFFVKEGQIEPKEKVLAEWQKTLFLREEKELSAKGWLLDVMRCVDGVGKKEFVLDDVYAYADELQKLHPENNHIKDKIRQQLQVLRDRGYLDFVSRGYYKLT
jgi:type II restriction enzyme